MPVKLLLFCLVVLAICPASAVETIGTIRWMINGLPPKTIPDGPLKGQGYGEQQFEWLARHLPNYQHRLEIVTPARLWYEMRTGQGVCSIDIAELRDREQWAQFSRHRTSVPNYRVLVRRDRMPEFSDFLDLEGRIDLKRLEASNRLTGIYVTDRYYMPEINNFIADPERRLHLEAMSASTRIFEAIAARRADFSFTTLIEMNYFNYLSASPQPGGKAWPPLAAMPIRGSEGEVHGHIACSRDELGRQVVEAIDRLLDDEANWAEFIAPEKRWLEESR